ncbi:asparagine--tRNA ligase [Riemerella anatipestifer]|uniref:Asparagine--tRNA ligase n=2 Tax=Riemerella anatipestifer TaxID=34085 RepID=J9R3D5_RIEAN|nr:asparagine--tRNA ligase [Riemerella anatipestifer]ADQ82701.1 asparaginyl-tRNA synthetase [Riemerella anatipestifer ATCC 11845 = DSM 15868]ADZ11807.1 Aspartyl/asparaginyl-tRNA synthetase [Riemerella anatipestifer RA-GD]AFD56710.1 asparaginyl-tRNA synthetase [Riemerella anatipestifer ATCC 11845 = DSM 15868]AFR34933.1 Aspartyl/asparaginyl-tRNA synthetase [Riemerella anatipestifer RA-CH-1]AGC39310.1 Aspartyl/asparaginyl-tRNA synthetase [Riemerella anatipestifer RA-CH-2]
MEKQTIKDILSNYKTILHHDITIEGWVRAFRSNRFIALNDGSTLNNLQIVVDFEKFDDEIIKNIHTASSLKVTGEVVESQGAGQSVEIIAKKIELLGENLSEELQSTILQPKRHTLEKLREQAHLRFRTNLFGAVFRVRSAVSFAIHQFFNQNQFFYINTPIITGADAEGAGEMFGVSNFDLNKVPKNEDGEVDYTQDFFGKKTNLTVSGQLEAETAAMGLGRVYTFGPTFRAENSNTTRHLAEFWMVEPEVAFNNLEDNIDLAESFLKYVIQYVLDHCKDDLELLDKRFAEEQKQKPEKDRAKEGLIEKLENVVKKRFKRVSYTEAIEILLNSKDNKKGKFQFPVEKWGADLQSEHERYLVEKHFECPVVLFDYPKEIKAFYMRLNEDQKTVAAMDVLFPGIGEIIGGSQREERLEVLKQKMADMNVDEHELWWYLDTRKFGSVPHAGFGLGLERLVLFVTGMTNIRDVIPFPRTPKNAEF